MARARPHTDHPISTSTPRATASCVARLLELAAAAHANVSLAETLTSLLDVLVDLEPGAAAAVRLVLDDEERVFERRSPNAAEGHESGVPQHSTPPPGHRRMFPDLSVERVIALPLPVAGSLAFGAPRFSAETSEGYDLLLAQAAAVVALSVRAAVPESRKERAASEGLAQLEKLATIGQTASQIVHELNNPLTAIIAYSDYLTRRMRDRDMPDGDVDRVMKINEAALRIQRFCRELTDYSRPAGSLRTPVDLREIVDSALSFCVHGLRSADITVERVYRETPAIEGIDTALTQVFVNLITNAWHAMPSGGTLSLRTRAYQGRVIVEVADEGQGIAEVDRGRIFDPYFTTKAKGSGVGLGLSIVKQIVDDHGGDIRAEPREPRGTIFVVSFPPFER